MNNAIATRTLLPLIGFVFTAGSIQAASLAVGFQNTVASESFQTVDNTYGSVGPARFYHISVNANNAGYASYVALDPSRSVIAPYIRTFSDPVVAWSFLGGGTNGVLTVGEESGGLISWATTDVTDPPSNTFDSFGQNQKKFWNATDPGADFNLPTNAAEVGTTTHDQNLPGYRSFNQSTTSVDISNLRTGTVNVFYGDFNGTPTMSAVMRDLDGSEPDIVLANFHLNGDFANRTELYAAELDFENESKLYDVIEYTYQGSAAGRSGGAVLTGVPEPSSAALLGLGGLALILRRRK